ncbi:hypothetical protein Hanom_Chr06g00485781 [Helianthus anomalus]
MLILITVRRFSRSETEVYQPAPSCLLFWYHHLPQIYYLCNHFSFFFLTFQSFGLFLSCDLSCVKKIYVDYQDGVLFYIDQRYISKTHVV